MISAVRAWALVIFGCVAIVFGLIGRDPTVVMLGFAVLGAEPVTRAAVNGVNHVGRPA